MNPKTYPLIVPKKLLLSIGILGVLLLFGGVYSKINGMQSADYQFFPGFILNTLFFVAVVLDIARNPVKNKLLWAAFLLVFNSIAGIVYIAKRDNFPKKS